VNRATSRKEKKKKKGIGSGDYSALSQWRISATTATTTFTVI
jgi:hypothetical protein